MLNNIESDQTSIPKKDAEGLQLDPREKLRSFLPTLPKVQARILNNLIELKAQGENEYFLSNKSMEILVRIVEGNKESASKKRAERMSAEEISVIDILRDFNGKERIIVARNSLDNQMLDGCAGGCPWCAVRAKRDIKKKISHDSLKEYVETYGKYFRKKSAQTLYFRSDPFDWISSDGEKDYVDLVDEFIHNSEAKIFTSTSMPAGTELSILRYVIYMMSRDEALKINNRMDRLGSLRFSRKKENKEMIGNIMQLVKELVVDKEMLKKVVYIVDREGDSSGGAAAEKRANIGYFINSSDRKETGKDVYGILSRDTLAVSPDGIFAESAIAATKDNPEGIRRIKQSPGLLEIPEFIYIDDYDKMINGDKFSPHLLPKLRYRIYRNGKYEETKTVESVGRDAMTFCLAFANLNNRITRFLATVEAKKHPEWALSMKKELLESLLPKYLQRKESCLSLLDSEPDKEAVRIAKDAMNRIDNWFVNIDKRMGIESN